MSDKIFRKRFDHIYHNAVTTMTEVTTPPTSLISTRKQRSELGAVTEKLYLDWSASINLISVGREQQLG